MITVNQLHPLFFGEIVGADLKAEPTPALRDAVQEAMDRFAVCVVRQGPITDAEHIRFGRLFGPLELPPGYGTRPPGRMAPELFSAGNLDREGHIKPLTPASRDVAKGAERFHADSSFNALPSKWSMLRGVECPPPQAGGDTLFIDTRAAYDDLPQSMKIALEHLEGIHDFWKGRERAGLEVSAEMRAAMPMSPPVTHPLVRTMPYGRKALYVGGHCVGVVGMSEEAGRQLVDELYAHCTQPHYIHRHRWTVGDIVIWENRCALHAATPLTTDRYRRDMRRVTINEPVEEAGAGAAVWMAHAAD